MVCVVDTCLVIDVLDDDPESGRAADEALDARAADGLVLCPVSYVELAPAFLDVLIGAFASNRAGLLTRNHADFRVAYPSLVIATPGS